MLIFRVTRDGDPGSARFDGREWRGLGISVTPSPHSALESTYSTLPDGLSLRVSERMTDPGLSASADSISLCIRNLGGIVTAEVSAGERGMCPIYLTCTSGELRGHWDPAALYGSLSTADLCPVYAAHFLAGLD